jgi:uncharacterized membrane protein YcgQ (UPF0703/DUF1980 family)
MPEGIKKFAAAICALLLMLSAADAAEKVLVIGERMFATLCEDIYLNPKKYEGRSVRLEGICMTVEDPDSGALLYGVFRYSPGCCGDDGLSGFEFRYSGAKPKEDDWIEVEGKLQTVRMPTYTTIVIKADKVTVKKKRGAEFVKN